MNFYRDNNISKLFLRVCHDLQMRGEAVAPRGNKTLELQDVWIEFTPKTPRLRESIIVTPERDLSMNYLRREMHWYMHGSYDVDEIAGASKFWKTIAKNGKVNSNYGQLVLREKNEFGMTQFEWCKKMLLADPQTRAAVMNYNQPKHKDVDSKDFVCTLNQQFRAKNGQLNTRVFMRSTDIVFGFSYDIVWFTWVLIMMAKATGLQVGEVKFYTASMHIYERHFQMLQDIMTKYYSS